MIKTDIDALFIKSLSCFISFVLLVLVSGCTSVVTNYWPAASVAGYPEQNLHILNKRSNGKTFGIAFSGGGTRSASATLGQLQALTDLGLIQQADYISAVSGGAWASVPYTFLPVEGFTDEGFLGSYVPPANLCDDDLEKESEGSFATAMANAKFSFFTNNLYFSAVKGKGDETYASYLGNIFLRPFNLKNMFYSKQSREYFTLSKATRNKLIGQNVKYGIKLKKGDFYTVRDGRPFLIVNSTLMPFHSPEERHFLPVEITPMYVGIPIKANLYMENSVLAELNGHDKNERFPEEPTLSVGGYVEPLAYDSKLIEKLDGRHLMMRHANPFYGFSLSDVLAATGSAPQQTLHKGGIFNVVTTNIGFPEFVHWSEYENKTSNLNGSEFDHGDGGHLDNLGIMPLLARQVDNILVFINAPTPFNEDTLEVVDDLTTLFDMNGKYTRYYKEFAQAPQNAVLADKNEYKKLLDAFGKMKRDGKPLVYCQKYFIKDSPLYNIRSLSTTNQGERYRPNICWAYLDLAQGWVKEIDTNSKLSMQMKDAILLRQGEFRHFPHYWTFINDLPNMTIIDKSEAQVKLLANLTAWSLRESEQTIAEGLGLTIKQHEDKFQVSSCGAAVSPSKGKYMVKVVNK